MLYERAIHGHGGVECEEIFAVFFAELEAPGPNIFGWRQTCKITNETESRRSHDFKGLEPEPTKTRLGTAILEL